MRLRSTAGFTLMEILVVVFIIGLLATLVTPKIINEYTKAKRTKAATDVKALVSALQRFHLDNGRYPTTSEGLVPLAQSGDDGQGYIERVPSDPWGNPYSYFSDGTRFLVRSLGSDGRDGGEGSASDITSDDVG